MSVPNLYVRCHGCNFVGIIELSSTTLEYILPGGSIVKGYCVDAWCTSCEDVTVAEEAFNSSLIQTEIDTLNRQKVDTLAHTLRNGKIDEDELQLLRDRLQLAKLRSSEPNCLRCGNPTVVPLDFDVNRTSSIVHTCGSRLFLVPENPDALQIFWNSEVIRLDPEGRKI